MRHYRCAIFFLFVNFCYSQVQVVDIQKNLDEGNYNKAQLLLEQKLTNSPENEFVISALGDLYSYKKDWNQAIRQYEVLVRINPGKADYNFKLGGALGMKALSVSKFQALAYISDIKKYLERAAEINPTHIESRRALVELYMQLPGFIGGSEEKAQKYRSELFKLNKVDGYLSEAFMFKETNKVQKALVAYRMAMKIHSVQTIKEKRNSLNYELGKISAEFNLEPAYGLRLLNSYIDNYNYKDIYSLEWAYYRKAQIEVILQNKNAARTSIEKALTLKHDFKEAKEEKQRILRL
ncbi:hypothetical protein L1I30_11265 [Gillisia sp. M10.2A]|uniref:Tetratricopeptide repeat protein n=1 Tax=Gillisia lutea TaxID=2909668 RepID=A0ABS9EH98_9FLAO|nr:hypothetical protein [Gillisia lutea]MCF4102248.1 hypothetical protein [Gillisia lutea]